MRREAFNSTIFIISSLFAISIWFYTLSKISDEIELTIIEKSLPIKNSMIKIKHENDQKIVLTFYIDKQYFNNETDKKFRYECFINLEYCIRRLEQINKEKVATIYSIKNDNKYLSIYKPIINPSNEQSVILIGLGLLCVLFVIIIVKFGDYKFRNSQYFSRDDL